MISKDILNQYKRKGQPARCAMKFDLRKAYNFVNWLLKKMHFLDQFCKWIMNYVSTSFSVSVNGGLCGFLEGKKVLGRNILSFICYLC